MNVSRASPNVRRYCPSLLLATTGSDSAKIKDVVVILGGSEFMRWTLV
jgi:hypothetical protein